MDSEETLPPFVGGAIGYFGYDAGWLLESLPTSIRADSKIPDLQVGLYDWVLATDHKHSRNLLIATGYPSGKTSAAEERLAGLLQHMDTSPCNSNTETPNVTLLRSNVNRPDYMEAIRQCKDYISAGDIYQVNLSHRLQGSYSGPT